MCDGCNNLNLATCQTPCCGCRCGRFVHDGIDFLTGAPRADCGPGSDRGEDCWGSTDGDVGHELVAEPDGEDDDGGDTAVPDDDIPEYQIPPGWGGYVDILDPAWICPEFDIVAPGSDPNHFDGCYPESIPDADADYIAYSTADGASGGALLSEADFNAALESWPEVAEQLEADDTYLD